jgi:hypothetical protein
MALLPGRVRARGARSPFRRTGGSVNTLSSLERVIKEPDELFFRKLKTLYDVRIAFW